MVNIDIALYHQFTYKDGQMPPTPRVVSEKDTVIKIYEDSSTYVYCIPFELEDSVSSSLTNLLADFNESATYKKQTAEEMGDYQLAMKYRLPR